MKSTSFAVTSMLLAMAAVPAFTNGQMDYVIPIDSSMRTVSFSVVFKPERRDASYDVLEKTGGQSFFLDPSEVKKVSQIEALTRGEAILVVNDTFASRAERTVSATRPSGRTVTSSDTDASFLAWSSGNAITIVNPEPGAWHLRIGGAGAFSMRVTGKSDIAIIGVDFVELAGRPGHEGYFPIGREPSVNAEQMLRVHLSEDSAASKMPTFSLVDEAGKVIGRPRLDAVSRGEFGEFIGAVKIPSRDFRLMVTGEDKSGFAFQRVHPGMIRPQK
jgi:hypothetical protein